MIVKASGPCDADIAILGEAPGSNEEMQGVPFVGAAGHELDRLLQAAGIERRECYLTNVIKERPPKNDFSIYYLDAKRTRPTDLLKKAHGEVIQELLRVEPNVIIACGNEALYALTGEKGITKRRGSLFKSEAGKVLATIHPSALLRSAWGTDSPTHRPLVLADFKKARRESEYPELRSLERQLIIEPTFGQVMETLARYSASEYLSFDIETRPLPPHDTIVRCIGLASSPTHAISIPFTQGYASYWPREHEAEILQALAQLFTNPKIRTIAHNSKFDMFFMAQMGLYVKNLWMDTMLAWHTYAPELPKSLATLGSVFSDLPYWKGMYESSGRTLWEYNCLDCIVTLECAMALDAELKEMGLDKFYFDLVVNPLILPVFEMERRGVLIDEAKRQKAIAEHTAKAEKAQADLNEAAGRVVNPKSPKQMKQFLYEELGLPVMRKGKKLTTDKDALLKITMKRPDVLPIINCIETVRRETKLVSTYLSCHVDPDGRMRTSYNLSGAVTGRWSSSKSLSGSGTNFQNFPKGVAREIFIPDEGKLFLSADLRQAETRVVAALSDEQRLLQLFREDADVHKINAAMIFDKLKVEVTKTERQLAKTIGHAANYGVGPKKLCQQLKYTIDIKQAETLLKKYYMLYPFIRIYHLETEYAIKTTRVLTNPFGRRREFFGNFNVDMVRSGLAYIPQSTVGDIINIGLLRLWKKLPNGAEIMLQIHDALVIQCRKEQVEEVKALMVECLVFPLPISETAVTIKIPVDIHVGANWNEVS